MMSAVPGRWQLEDLMEPGAMGKAEAAARFHGDTSARRALAALAGAVRVLAAEADVEVQSLEEAGS